MTQAEAEHRIIYEGPGEGSSIMGASLANFLIEERGADKECAVMLNDPAANYLAEQLGAEMNDAWREAVTEHVGRTVIDAAIRESRHIDSVVFVSRAILEAHPEFVEAVRSAAV